MPLDLKNLSALCSLHEIYLLELCCCIYNKQYLSRNREEGLGLPQVVKKVSEKVIILKSTEESIQKCNKKVRKLKRTKSTLAL